MTTKTLKHEIKAEYLLDKGMVLMWAKGYNATSVNDIVKEAGIPKGSFYFYFKSKEDFAVKALDRYFNEHFEPAFNILTDPELTAKERLMKFYEYRGTMLKEELECKMGCLGCNLSNEMAEHSEAIRKTILSKSEYVKALITDVAKEAQKDGDLDADMDVESIISFIEDAGKGVMITMKEVQNGSPVDNLMHIVKTVLLK